MTEVAPPVRAIHRIDSIIVGERGNRNLGDEKAMRALKASIVRDNLIHPLILTPDRHLVLGARRLEACGQLGWTDVPAMTVTWIWQALEYLETEHRDPRCLQPLTVHEAMGMDVALRELQWWRKAQPSSGTPATGRAIGNERRSRIARLLGMNQHQYVQARELWQAARGYRETFGYSTPVAPPAQKLARILVADIREPADVSLAYRTFRENHSPPPQVNREKIARATRPAALPVPPARSTRAGGRRTPQRAQAAQIRAGLASISGTLAALMSIRDLDPALSDDQLGDWADDVTGMRRDLTTFRKRLEKGQQ